MNIAVMGYGVVGSGVVEVVYTNHEKLLRKTKQDAMEVKYILDLREFPDSPYVDRFTKDFNVILNDDDVQIVVETMGGLHPAFEYVSACLAKGKHVVTSNKELVAAKGIELLQIAKENHVNFMFEASVGGGIPIIRPISQCLAGNEIDEIAGILNGTTNFILTKMIREKMDFAQALKIAQELGYAERNPAADVEGHDTCRKICILASLSFGKHVYPEQVHTEGITDITLEDVEYACAWGGAIKLLGCSKMLDNGKISAIVCPAFVPDSSQLASVEDVFNAILVRGNVLGDVVFYGRGAGKLPTASAVVADVIDCANHKNGGKSPSWGPGEEGYVVDYKTVETSLYVRATAEDTEAVLHKVKQAFGDVQELTRKHMPDHELAFVTPVLPEQEIRQKLETIEDLNVITTIRVTDY